MSYVKVDVAILFKQEMLQYILYFSFTSIIIRTELLKANSIRKCGLYEFISYVRNI